MFLGDWCELSSVRFWTDRKALTLIAVQEWSLKGAAESIFH